MSAEDDVRRAQAYAAKDGLHHNVLECKSCHGDYKYASIYRYEVEAIMDGKPSAKEQEALDLEKARTAERLTAPRRYDPQVKAKELVSHVYNAEDFEYRSVVPSELYVVTFAYILGGWKAMISSDAWDDTSYFEVTHNKAKGETYVDHYRKVSNTCFKDEV